jgi:hypothetical protein
MAGAASAGVAEVTTSSSDSIGSRTISWILPSAPSAWLTADIAPMICASGITSRNRNMRNPTSAAIERSPAATRAPPTPSTTRNATCSATPAIGTTSADTRATRMPAR